ncbi:olfactory receptor 8B3-like [Mus pahari]|uniref:olfactory receptor 8B3-like n=1 Tax=Mus pahari TaxID=10093 RepID=UPI000A30D901|nr:olfactory receptor 8B3-like [Mus pahari]
MVLTNGSLVTEFILLGLTDNPDLQIPLFLVFLVMYMITVFGNLTLILLTGLNSHLHTPMYFFLFNLSFIDLCYSSVITPKLMMNFVLKKNIIGFAGCMTQLFFFCFFAVSECYVLTAMAYDRYVAICNPLMYNVAMSPKVCSCLILGSYLMGFSDAMIHTGCILRLSFCDGNTINHYFCDLLPLMQLSCTSTYVNEVEIFIVGGKDIRAVGPALFISYGFILLLVDVKQVDISHFVQENAYFASASGKRFAEVLPWIPGEGVPKGDTHGNSSSRYSSIEPLRKRII